MAEGLVIILLFSTMLVMLLMGAPFAFSIGATALLFAYFLWGPNSLAMVATNTFGIMKSTFFLAVPLFILMGNFLQRSGIADNLYELVYNSLGRVRGGLAVGTVIICTMFAAMAGISGAATISMGLIALPSMFKRNYDKSIAMGCISAGGALGILIPPSVTMIIYGTVCGVSIGRLFAGGILPGLLLATLFIVYILIRAALNPSIGPALPREGRASLRVIISQLPALILPIFLIVAVLGSMFSGLATPTEAAAVGALGAIVAAAINRRLNWSLTMECCRETLKYTAMILWIVICAYWLSSTFAALGGGMIVEELVGTSGLNRWVILICIQAMLMVMGCLMDSGGIIIITAPIFAPIIRLLNFDPTWFGILFIVNMEMSFLTPPFGVNLFYMRAIVPPGITMGDIYRSIIPFVLLQLTGLFIVMLVPEIALFIPRLLFG